jgi:hypothetical protein
MKQFRPYSVVSPPFELTSGGVRVLYALHGWLLAKGQVSYMTATYDNKDFVAVYPEVYRGNMVNTEHIVRYILAKPGFIRLYGVPGPKVFDKEDKIFIFSELYNTFGADKDHIMFLPVLNMHLFKDQKRPRTKTCFYVGKGINLDKHPKDAININREIVQDQQGLADTLNGCSVMYGYDPVSAIYEVARLCGCRVVLIPEGHYTKEQWSTYEPGMNGITWGLEEPTVELDTKEFRSHYEGMIKEFEKKLDFFIDETQKM